MTDFNTFSINIEKATAATTEPTIGDAMRELQQQISRYEDSVQMLMDKAAGVMRPLPSAPNVPNDVPTGSPLAIEIWRKADDLRVANNNLYQITIALDL